MADTVNGTFKYMVEGERGWQIRYGAEPIDLHLLGKGSREDKWLEAHGVTAGVGSVFNHNYIEILNPSGEVMKRVHGLGLNNQLQMAPTGRLVGLVVDGKYTRFETDDPIQRDDPHETKRHNLQHADEKGYTKIVFSGSEREVLEIYGAMIRGSIEINNKDLSFHLFGQNSNTFNAEMKEKVREISEKMGVNVDSHDPPRWDIGSDDTQINTMPASRVKTWGSMGELKNYIDELEKTAHEQWATLNRESQRLEKGQSLVDINLQIPAPSPFK